MTTYKSEFKAAVAKSREFGASPRAIAYTDNRLLDTGSLNRLAACFRECSLEPEDLIGRCIQINYEFIEPIAEIFGVHPVYTIGYVSTSQTDSFRFADNELSRWVRKRNVRLRPVNVHAWLTLPSMEIIDLTITSTVAKLIGHTGAYGLVIARHPDDLEGMTYHPKVVGEQVIFRMGAAKFTRPGNSSVPPRKHSYQPYRLAAAF